MTRKQRRDAAHLLRLGAIAHEQDAARWHHLMRTPLTGHCLPAYEASKTACLTLATQSRMLAGMLDDEAATPTKKRKA